jgi:hypothetical protein
MLKNFFHKLDSAVFKLIDNVRGTPQYSQLANAIEGLPDEGQKAVNQGLTYFLSFLPILILLIVLLLNTFTRSRISEKEEIIENITQFNLLRTKSNQIGNDLIGQTPLNGENDLKAKLAQISGSYGLQRNDLDVISFESSKFGDLIQSKATIAFKGLSTPKLFGILDNFLVQERARLDQIKLSKRNASLTGEFSFLHYGRQGPSL